MDDILYKIKNLEIKSRSKNGSRLILSNINLIIKKNEIISLIGKTGSGKSILGCVLIDMLPSGCFINRGEVLQFFDFETQISKLRGLKVARISQDSMQSLNPLQTIEAQFNIILTKRLLNNKAKAKKHIFKWIKKVHLHKTPNILKRYPHQLSGGQMQRVMIAMAISVEPKFIIADEITTGLDANIKMEILNLLYTLQKELKFSVLFISHDLNIVKKYSDRIILLKSGKLNNVKKEKITIEPFFNYGEKVNEISNKTEKTNPKTKQKPILYIKDIYKTYGNKNEDFFVLKGVSLNIYKGKTLGVIGESGSGKTTLIKIVLNILNRNSGDIIFKNKNLVRPNKKIGAVFQDSLGSLNPRMKVYDIIREPLVVGKNKECYSTKKKIITALVKVGLDPSISRFFPSQLSGGQRQRVSIARSIVINPSILVLDEPTSSLDVNTQKRILELFNEIQSQNNLSYIFISHDLQVIAKMSDSIAVLYKGKIVESGKPNHILINPSHDYTKKLIYSNAGLGKKSIDNTGEHSQ